MIRLDNFSHGHPELVFDKHHFTAGDQPIVDVDIDGLADLTVEFEHRAGAEFEQVADFHMCAPQHGRDLDRDVEDSFEAILDFAEVGEFIEAPLRTYSSGMASRLGFAVATAWPPEILLIDEVLSVGDEAFRHKCQARMREFRESGTTILMVSHDLVAVQELCGRVAWLERGRIRMAGSASDVVAAYKAS